METLKLEIKQLLIDTLDLEELTPPDIADDVELFGDSGMGLDSIDALELGVALRKKYRLQLEAGDAGIREHFRTVNSLVELVRSRRKDG
ncbi:MAG: acyl carrier protein [Betaproteobacteria bacterium]|nr:acyl carrier protein [Betaproteobacteria bacterium]